MNCRKMLVISLFAGVTASAGAMGKVWNFDSINEVAPAPWAGETAFGYVNEGENIACADGNFNFILKTTHSWFWLNFGEAALDAKQYNLLKFRFYSPVAGKIILYYSSPDREMASMDAEIAVAQGWNDYEIDMKEMTFGGGYKSEECKDKNYKRWGGEPEQVSGLRIDPWFPKGTTVKFDYIKLSDGKEEGADSKKDKK